MTTYPNAHIVSILAVALCVSVGCSEGIVEAPVQEPAASAPSTDQEAIWEVTEGMNAPESAHLDRQSNTVFVSVINGEPGARDGNGHIARLTPDGAVIDVNWATGLNAPKGLAVHDGTLWVADLDEVVGIDIETAAVTSRVAVEGAEFLNDLAAGPDGTIYISDSQANRIYAIADGVSSVFADGEAVEAPNGVLVDEGRLVIGSMRQAADPESGPGRLFALDLTTRDKTILSSEPIGAIDGVESDGSGGYVVTAVFEGQVVHVSASGAVRTLLDLEGMAADLAYDPARSVAIVPSLFGNTVAAYDLSDVID